MDIHVRFTQDQSIRKIARELGISRNTVKHHLRQQQSQRILDVHPNRPN